MQYLQHFIKKHNIDFQSINGFALPSVLFLITILSIVVLSILSLQYFHRQLALIEIAKSKADLSALNGIVSYSASVDRGDQTFQYCDGGTSRVHQLPWGLFTVAYSHGEYKKAKSTSIALLGQSPTEDFSKALVYSNTHHQLILAGESSIHGDVDIGKAGVSIGSMIDLMTPRAIPIEGKINQHTKNQLPFFNANSIERQIEEMDGELDVDNNSNIHGPPNQIFYKGQQSQYKIDLSQISDSVETIIVDGNAEIWDSLNRRELPLRVIVRGMVTIRPFTRMSGTIALLTSDSLVISPTIRIEHALLYSRKSIAIIDNSEITAQLFAPTIKIKKHSRLHYPSVLYSWCSDTSSTARTITIAGSASVEGILIMGPRNNRKSTGDLIILEKGSTIVGAVYCGEKMTLDGSVAGTVITNEFYFNQTPTYYYGWIRGGTIDRQALPKGFLIPTGFSMEKQLSVIDWL